MYSIYILQIMYPQYYIGKMSSKQVQVPAKGGGFGANYVLTRVCNISGLEKPQTRVCGQVSKAE